MKKIIALLLLVVMSFSLVACGNSNDDVDPIVVDGQETSVKAFLIENLSEYISGEDFIQRQNNFKDSTGSEPTPFTVTRVIELEAKDLGATMMSIHYLAVKADCQYGLENGDLYSDTLLIVDYETGNVYDQFMVDETWMNDSESKDYWTYVMLNGPLCGSDYDGGTIIVDSEVRTELSSSEIADINAELHK